jgi:hypothetical protein
MPDDKAPWEQIFDYRSDPDSQRKFLALRRWMSKIARGELSPAEVEEEVEGLIDDYQSHLKLHKLKTTTGTLQTIVETTTELLENTIKFNWGKAAKLLFSLRQRKYDLNIAELGFAGKEVAYIIRARDKFSDAIE